MRRTRSGIRELLGSRLALAATTPLLLGLLVAGVAQAQWEPTVPPACPEAPADPEQVRNLAGDLFRQASQQHEAGAYFEAVALFSCCFHVMPHPNTLYNLGVSAQRAGDLETAEKALERYLAEAAAESPYRGDAEALLAAVRVRRSAAVVPPLPDSGEPGAGTTVEAVPPPPEEVEPRAATGGEAVPAETVAVLLGTTMPETSAPPPPAETPGLETAGWALLASGAAVAAGGGIAFALLAKDEVQVFENAEWWSDAAPHRDLIDTYTGLEIASLAVGGAAVVVGTLLLVLSAVGEEAPPLSIAAPIVTTESVGAALGWRF